MIIVMAVKILEISAPKETKNLSNSDILTGKKLHPVKVIKTYDSDEFELFIHEWAYGYLKSNDIYKSVFKIGGSGDKGRDILAYADDEKSIADYYQCKHYDKPLSETNIWVEVGKICYNIYTNQIICPRKYYFIAPRDLTPKLLSLLHSNNKKEFKEKLFEKWKKNCENSITISKKVVLDQTLKDFILKMDFNIFDTKPILEIIDQHSKTKWAAPRFGGGLRKRPLAPEAPSGIDSGENIYVEELMEAYRERTKKDISSPSELGSYSDEQEHFKHQRNAYYSTEALRVYARESLPPEYDDFEKFKDDIYNGVINTVNKQHVDALEKIDAVSDRAMELPIEGNILVGQIRTLDKHGACHHLVNEGKIKWKNKKTKNS